MANGNGWAAHYQWIANIVIGLLLLIAVQFCLSITKRVAKLEHRMTTREAYFPIPAP